MNNNNIEMNIANENKFNPIHYSDELTAFTREWKDSDEVDALLNFVAPAVPVSRRFEYKQSDTDEMFFSEEDDMRARGSSFKRIEFTGKLVHAKTINKGLTVRVDDDDVVGCDWRERYVSLLIKRLYRNELRRALLAINENATESETTWAENKQPDADIRDTLVISANETGFFPNRILFGELAWYSRMDSYCSQNNAGARISAELNRSELAEKLLVEDIKLLRKQHLGLQATEVNGNEIYAFYAKNGLLKDEPSNIKRFVTPFEHNNKFRVYVEEHAKYTDITVEHYSNIVITSSSGILKLIVK